MSLSIVIRPVVAEDLDRLIEISKKTFMKSFLSNINEEDIDAYVSTAFSRIELRRQLQNPCSAFFFARLSAPTYNDDNAIIGYCKVNLWDAQKENIRQKDSLQLHRLYVDQRYQGHGVGQQLLDYIEQNIARDLYHVSSIWLSVWKCDERAIRFYEKNGYQKFGTVPFMLGTGKQTHNLMRKEFK